MDVLGNIEVKVIFQGPSLLHHECFIFLFGCFDSLPFSYGIPLDIGMDKKEFGDVVKTLFAISQNIERKKKEQYDRIMGILGKHEEMFLK